MDCEVLLIRPRANLRRPEVTCVERFCSRTNGPWAQQTLHVIMLNQLASPPFVICFPLHIKNLRNAQIQSVTSHLEDGGQVLGWPMDSSEAGDINTDRPGPGQIDPRSLQHPRALRDHSRICASTGAFQAARSQPRVQQQHRGLEASARYPPRGCAEALQPSARQRFHSKHLRLDTPRNLILAFGAATAARPPCHPSFQIRHTRGWWRIPEERR